MSKIWLSVVLCVGVHGLASIRATAQVSKNDPNSIESHIAALSKSNDPNEFDRVSREILAISKQKEETKHFDHGVLFTKLLCAIEQRIDHEFDPADPANMPFLNISPGPGLRSGVSPRSVKNPEIRKKYETALAKNEEKIVYRRMQTKLPRIAKRMRRQIFVFYRTHFDSDEDLNRILTKSTKDEKLRRRIHDQLVESFKQLDKQYTVESGTMIGRPERN